MRRWYIQCTCNHFKSRHLLGSKLLHVHYVQYLTVGLNASNTMNALQNGPYNKITYMYSLYESTLSIQKHHMHFALCILENDMVIPFFILFTMIWTNSSRSFRWCSWYLPKMWKITCKMAHKLANWSRTFMCSWSDLWLYPTESQALNASNNITFFRRPYIHTYMYMYIQELHNWNPMYIQSAYTLLVLLLHLLSITLYKYSIHVRA